MSEIGPQTVFAQSEAVLFTELDDEMSLMDIESGEYYHYDATGAAVWKRLDGTTDIAGICAGLREDFDVSEETCRKDTIAFLQQLEEMQLVKRA